MDEVLFAIGVAVAVVVGIAMGYAAGTEIPNRVEGYCAAMSLEPARHGDRWICIDPSKFAEVKE